MSPSFASRTESVFRSVGETGGRLAFWRSRFFLTSQTLLRRSVMVWDVNGLPRNGVNEAWRWIIHVVIVA